MRGHVTDGNRSDTIEHRFHITQLRQFLPDLGEPLLVADSKFFAGETLALAGAHQFRFVTLVPQTVRLRQELVAGSALRALPLLWEQPGRRTGQIGSAIMGPRWCAPIAGRPSPGEVHDLPLALSGH